MKKANQVRLAKRYGINSSTISYWAHTPTFPAPILGTAGKTSWYHTTEVDAWVVLNRPKYAKRAVSVVELSEPTPTPTPAVATPTANKSTLDVILFLLENDKAKQKLVLDLLLD